MMWINFCIYIAAGVLIEDVSTSNPSSTSAVDLGLLLIALKEINAHQTNVNFFARKLESDICRAGIVCSIPTDLRGMAGISIPQQGGVPSPPEDAPYCDTSQHRYS